MAATNTNMRLEVTIYDDEDRPLEIIAEFSGGMKGSRDRYGVQMEPDDQPTIEIIEVCDADGESRDLTSNEHDRAMSALWDESRNIDTH